jgi:flavin-dependent dehydrogenase
VNSDGARVIVVGGGPAGAATAFYLARSGVDVMLLDSAHFPRDKPCSEYMSPQASRILDEMGVLERIEQSGAAHLAGMRIRAPNGATFQGRFAEVHGYRGYRDRGLALRRSILDGLLLERARSCGAVVREGVRVTALRRDSAGRVIGGDALDAHGAEHALSASIIVGADGLRSIVARRLELATTRLAQRRLAFVTHFAGVDGIGDNGEMHVEHDGYLGLADVGGGVTNVAVVVPRSHAREASESRGIRRCVIRQRRHVAPRFAHAERVTPCWQPARLRPSRAGVGTGCRSRWRRRGFLRPVHGRRHLRGVRGAELPHRASRCGHRQRTRCRRIPARIRPSAHPRIFRQVGGRADRRSGG